MTSAMASSPAVPALRGACRDCDEGADVFEWYRVSRWMVGRLRDAGEVVIDNGYGEWWGRTCTGQSIDLDSTFYDIASEFLRDSD